MKKILIIDDDTLLTDGVKILLESQGYSVDSAINGKDGYAKAKASLPDLILLDVMMTTKTEGFALAKVLHEDPTLSKVPVVMVTGIRNEMDLAFSFGPDNDWLPVKAVLEKPVKPEQLIKTVIEVIGK